MIGINLMVDLNEIYLTGKTLRYHARPEIGIFNQNTADHSWGLVTLMVLLKPDVSREAVLKGHFHDAGERWAGDLPHPFKRANAYVAQRHAVTEHRLARENGVPQFDTTDEEDALIKLCDLLEAYLFVKLRRSDIIEEESWMVQREEMIERAYDISAEIGGKVEELLE